MVSDDRDAENVGLLTNALQEIGYASKYTVFRKKNTHSHFLLYLHE